MRGFTLVELLVTIAVVAIVLTVGIPAWGDLIASTRMTTATNGLIVTLAYARSEAVKVGPTTVCPRELPIPADGEACSALGDWSNGAIVFEDPDRSGDRTPTEALRYLWEVPQNGALVVTSDLFAITFERDGSVESGGVLRLCDTYAQTNPRAVRVQQSGSHTLFYPEHCE